MKKTLYKDSFSIEESWMIDIDTDSSGKEKWHSYVQYYTFIDLRTKTLYKYLHFSDTARLVMAYTLPDSVFTYQAFDYFGKRPSRFGDQSTRLPDTVINGITYKRIQNDSIYKREDGNQYQQYIGYFRCDQPNLLVHFERKQSRLIGCPMVRLDILVPQNNTHISNQIEVIDTLTEQERKVFAAWEQNARQTTKAAIIHERAP